MISRIAGFSTLLSLLLLQTVYASDKVNHESDGKTLFPYLNAPPEIHISAIDHEKLQKNKSIYKQLETSNGKQLAIVFKVNATPQKIWSTIKSYAKYPDWIKNIKEAEIYKQENENIYVRFVLKHWVLGKYQYYMKHNYSGLAQNWATWSLDEEYASDFKSSIGFWRVYPIDKQKKYSYVVYSADILFRNKKSKFIRSRAIKSSLKQASTWVREQSEK